MLKCALDMDGILSNFVGRALEIHNYDPNLYELPTSKDEWQIWKLMGFTDETEDQFWKPLNCFEFWSSLEFMPDAHEILYLVEKKFKPENIVILTSPTRSHHCSAGKQAWIQLFLHKYRRRFMIGTCKDFFIDPNVVLIDDFNGNVDGYREGGGHAILVPRPWNRKHERDTLTHLKTELDKL